MSSGDSRKDFILSAIVDFFQLPSKQYMLSELFSSKPLNTFLDDRNCFILSSQIDTTKEEIKIVLQNKVEPEENQKRILIFVKIQPNVITPDNLYSDIFISSISDSPINALYHTVKKVFAPVLLKNERWSEIFNPKLQNLLCDLEIGLGTVVRQSNGDVLKKNKHQNKSLAEIQVPLDEFKYWADKSINGSSESEKQRANHFYKIFNQLENSFANLNSLPLAECKDFLDIVFTVLDDIWKQEDFSPPYPQDRMEHLLEIIGNTIAIHIQKELNHLGIWEQSFSIIEDHLHQGIDLCETWQDICQKLTTIYWPNFNNHPWKKSAFIPTYIVKFSERLLQILDLRAVHYQLTKLLSSDEQNELKMSNTFLVFKDMNPLQYNSYTDQIWKLAVKKYEDELFPAEKRVANKLRMQLQTTQNNVLQLIQQFKRYEELIKRPGIQNELTPEREMLLGQLLEYIANVRQEFSQCIKGNTENLPQLTNMPEIISNIIWIRQLEKKLNDIRRISQVLLKDLSSYQNFCKELEEVINEFQDYHKEQFGNWCREIQMGIKEKSLSLDIDQPVISLDRQGQPHVNYSPRLVSLMREVRQLRVLGYSIPSRIQDLDDKAKSYYSQAKDLQQIVNFYKTIADHMILSQQPMMLEAARAFTNLVNEKNSISWDNPNSLNVYINKLQGAVERLSRENRMLRKFHYKVCEMVLGLMNTDLLRQQQHWKDVLNNIRSIMTRLQEQGFSAENMRAWKAHWDRQLYKTLEHQYQLGIETLNENLSEIKIDLIYRNGTLQFRPPIEEIRAKYYSQMKKFLSIPTIFKGVNDFVDNLIFPIIIERNSQQFIYLYKKAENLFRNLEAIRNKLKDWVVLGSLNIDEFVENHCITPEDWKKSFKIIKAKSQEFSKLQLEDEKLDCINISYAPIKAYIDYLLSELDVVMVRSLRKSVQKDCQNLQEFLTEAITHLTYNPQSVEELAEANKKQLEYHQKKDHFLQLYQDVQTKNEFLGKWSRNAVIELSSLQGQWDTFERIIDDHSELIVQQVEILKTKVLNDLKNYEKEIERFSAHWNQFKPQNELFEGDINQIEMIINIIKEKRTEFNELLQTKEKLLNDMRQFNIPEPDLSNIEDLEKDLIKTEQIWFLFDEFKSELHELSKEEWILFRNKVHHFELFLNDWIEKIEKQKILDEPKAITILLHQEINKYKKVIPALKYCRGDVFSSSHWTDMFHLLNMSNSPIEKLLFGDFLAVKENIIDNIENLKELNSRAQGEVTIREALNELDLWSARTKFLIIEHEDSQKKKIILIKDWKDILNKVGENQCLIQSLKDSPYYKHFADRASIWENRLTILDLSLQQLNQVQRKWLYLEPILGRGALPSEHTRFQNICNDFRSIMDNIAQDAHVISLTNYSGLTSKLNSLIDQLHRCQKALNQFLEEKRSIFSRFYFIGDEDLLEILGQATQPNIIQSHLKKMFAGIHTVEFDEDCSHIIAIKSVEEETVFLQHQIQVTPNIEIWLGNLEKEVKNTLKLLLKQSLKISKAEGQGGLDPSNFPSQILCLTEQIMFTEKCERAIQNNSMHSFLDELKAQLDSFTSAELSQSTTESCVLALKLKALILDTIHEIAVVEYLINKKVKSINDWYWQKQLRFYLRNDGIAIGKMVDAEFEYTYEYQGNPSKLVHTPLTDKCYLTLTQGMKMGMGGYPYGPAGTGKTESVKALGNLLGRQVLVFNCDEGIDVKSMNRIFIGLVKCGAWGCFDEFNRLEETVLSALSVQIQSIQSALKNKITEIELLDKKVDVNPHSGIFITLNPAGKGYGGRQKLPDNLKQLFRPVAMAVPDNELIAEVLLFSEGFKYSKILGCKLVAIFNLAKDLLTPKQHYDWGLRGLKTILQSCGKLLQTEKQKQSNEKVVGSEIFETELVVQALRVNTISKLSFIDAQHFDELVLDVFPNIKLRNLEYENLSKAIKEVCTELKMVIIENQVKKIMELYEQLQQRIGVVIVGLSGSGKSTLWKLLKQALIKMRKTVKHYLMNPKSISRTQLLGYIDADTREWHDGVLTASAREVVRESQDVHSWIVCDGDIDPEWIESLNSVLDDNHLLTLPSGERLQFGQNVNFLFETDDLNNASPATISRMGIIFLSEEDIDIKALVTSWIQQQSKEYQVFLENMINQYFFKSLNWIIKQNEYIVETSVIGLLMNGLSHLSNILSKFEFAISLTRGLGSNLNKENQEAFMKQVFSWMEISAPNPNKVLNTFYNEKEDYLDYYSSEMNHDIPIEKFVNGNPPVIVTCDIQQSAAILLPWLKSKTLHSILLVGPEGCGKSMILQYCFHQLHSVHIATVHCTAQTTPCHVLQKILSLCMTVNSHSGRILRPKECEKLILHLKDINLPKPDKWGTCQLISWLQQVITYQGFYDNDLEWITIDGIQIISSFSSGTSLGKHSLPSRFTSVVRICAVSYPDDDQLKHIYTSYLKPILLNYLKDNPVWSSFNNIQQLAGSMVEILKQIKSRFPSDENNHYKFTPKCLTELVTSFLRYDLDFSKSNNSSEELLHIWTYEVCRIFRDCLIDNESREKFDNILNSLIRADWGINVLDLLNDWYYVAYKNPVSSNSFGKLLRKINTEDWQVIVEKSIHIFSHEVQELNVVIFKEVLNYMARIDRVLTKPGGSLLLAGVSGIGRRLSTRIISHMHQIIFFSPKIHRNYSVNHFKNDLKSLMQSSGIEDQHVVLLIEDYQLLKPEFLEMINSLLASGEIPGLYNSDEFETLMNSLRNQASEEGWRGSLLDYFSFKVKKNLHVVLVMDFTSNDFHLNCEGNPSLYKYCSVQWMDEWCQESMIKIPKDFLTKHSEKFKIGNDEKCFIDDDFLNNFVKLHKLCEKSIATPRRYVTFVQNFCAVFDCKKLLITKRKTHLQAGVSKLNEAKALVDNLKSEAAEQSKLLAEKQSEADDALKQITSSMSSTSDQKTEMENLKSKIEEENKKIAKRKKEIEFEMKEIEPIVQEAKAAVGNIRSEALSEIRSLRAPPDIIRDILEGVLRLMGIFDTSWVSMKSFLSKRGIKEEIISFDAHKITPEIRYSVEQLLSKNHESFDPKNAKRASAAAAPLASWVKANVKYSQVLEKVSPLEKEQAKLQHNLVSAERRINKLSGALEDVEQQVIHLRDKLSKFTKEAAEIEFNLKRSKEIIISAETLVQQLDTEYQRWTKQLGEIDMELNKLPLQSLLAATFITYLSSTSEDVRLTNIEKWCSILGCESFDLKQFLSNEQEQLTWKAEGLPSDLLSIENAIIILQSTLYPFLIDPSYRATDWLKFHMRNTNLDVISQQDNNFPTSLELAVRFGKTLIVQDVDSIEPLLYSLLRADLISQGPRYVIQIGEKLVDFNENFKMFLITKYSSLELPPYASALITTINFSTTNAGLMGQLLALVLQHEKPELEKRRMELLEQEEELKLQLTKLEESLLEQLASAQGNILDNKELIGSLNNTKSSSLNISSALKESQQLQLSLEEERKVYLPLAQFGSNLYFVITELIKLNNMYNFSLSTFFKLFNQALLTNKISNNPEDKIKGLIQSLQHLVYEYVCRSLFKTDRLTFAMHLIHGMYSQHFQDKEWEAFIGMLITDVKLDKNEMKSLLPDWVEEERALAVTLLKNTFPNLFSSLKINDNKLWNTFAKSYQCEQEIPTAVEHQLTPFQQVLLIQALRPDRLQSAMIAFSSKLLSLKELSPPTINLQTIYINETVASEPILIIISPGADPSQELQELSTAIVGSEHYYQVSMGQGQMEIAIEYLQNCAQEGNWLCLKNLHLVTHWLPTLIKEFSKLNPHENFRLWLTSEPHPKFSPILLQMSLKLTYEAPPGVKKNLLRTYDSWSQEYVSGEKNVIRSHMLFILAWFHAILQERRMYIPQGWTKFYEFSLADLRAGADIIDRIYKNPGSIKINQLDYIHGLYESAIYGGRIDNSFDMRILISYLRQFFNNHILSGTISTRKYFSCNIQLPSSAEYQEYIKSIYQMPEDDNPLYFGLPANIERSTQRIFSNQVIQQLKLLARHSEVASKFDINRWNIELSPILNLWKKLNQGVQLIQMNIKPPTEDCKKHSPLNSFIHREYYNGIYLVQFIHSSLAALSKVIRGSLLLTKEIQQLARSLLHHETPSSWQKKWDGPEDPLHYLRGVMSRALAIQKWLKSVKSDSLINETLDLSELFRPDTFLNAFRQETAREIKVSMDNLKFVSNWSGPISGSKICLKITGLQLVGCLFDGIQLTDCKRDSPSITEVPPCYVAWISKDFSPYQETVISLPIYFTQERERIVTCLDVPCGDTKDHWLQCGAAFLLKNS